MVAHTCNLSTGEAEAQQLQVEGLIELLRTFLKRIIILLKIATIMGNPKCNKHLDKNRTY